MGGLQSFGSVHFALLIMANSSITSWTGRLRRSLVVFIAVWFLLGFAIAMLMMPVPWNLWQDTGAGKAISKSILALGFPNLAGHVRVFATYVPDWIAACLMGLLFGRYKRTRAVTAAIACAGGLALGPDIWYRTTLFFIPAVPSTAKFLLILLIPRVVTVFLAFSCARLMARRHQIPPGHCQRCGYDLTGNESGICPECGQAIETSDG